jgi:hypothetical protein
MSTSVASETMTLTQRINQAQQHAANALHADDAKRAAAAVLEMALEEMRRNPGFSLRVRGRYNELAPAKPRRASSTKAARATRNELIPIKKIEGREFDVTAALDPYFLLELYGAEQFPDALDRHPRSSIEEAVGIVKERHPGTKPGGRTKAALIEYIVRYVAK